MVLPKNHTVNIVGAFLQAKSGWIDHHLQLLKVSDTVKTHRADILRLVPSFASHPAFESDLLTVHWVSYSDYTSLALPSGDESFVKIAPTLVVWSSME